MAATNLVVALTGASGAPYGVRLVETLLRAGRTVQISISPAAVQVMERELGRTIDLDRFDAATLLGEGAIDPQAGTPTALGGHVPQNPCPPKAVGMAPSKTGQLIYHHYRDFSAGIASGSFLTGGMAVCPCSMGTVAAIAHGLSDNLIHRAADVHLKERRKLVLVPRETPLGLVQLRNLAACAEAGAIVLPAMPGFYTRPQTVADLVDFVVGRVCDQLGVEHRLFERWGQEK